MIVAILYSSPTFEAVDYNERKVAKGDASLLLAENFGYIDTAQKHRSAQLQQYLIAYSQRNERIQKPQMHVSFSCKGNEKTTEELVLFARQWINEMGYNQENQPLLIYHHKDTLNNHIHIVTSRVDPQGKKIDHNHERVRSKAFVEKALGVDTKTELDKTIQTSFKYKFESLSQWEAILESSGYSVQEQGDILKIARNGAYQHRIPKTDVERLISSNYTDSKRLKQLKALLLKYRDHSCSKEELLQLMKRKFGVDLVFFGGKDNPRGYFVIDHKNQRVYKGSSILKIANLLSFESPKEKVKRIDELIDATLEANPDITSIQLGYLLAVNYSASYSKGLVRFGTHEHLLKDYMYEAIKYNDKVKYVKSFIYATEEEQEVLCNFFKIKSSDLSVGRRSENIVTNNVLIMAQRLIEAKLHFAEMKEVFSNNNMQLLRVGGKHFVLDVQGRGIYCLENYGIHIPSSATLPSVANHTKEQVTNSLSLGRYRNVQNSEARSTNREFEVGTNGRYDEIDDARTLKR